MQWFKYRSITISFKQPPHLECSQNLRYLPSAHVLTEFARSLKATIIKSLHKQLDCSLAALESVKTHVLPTAVGKKKNRHL